MVTIDSSFCERGLVVQKMVVWTWRGYWVNYQSPAVPGDQEESTRSTRPGRSVPSSWPRTDHSQNTAAWGWRLFLAGEEELPLVGWTV